MLLWDGEHHRIGFWLLRESFFPFFSRNTDSMWIHLCIWCILVPIRSDFLCFCYTLTLSLSLSPTTMSLVWFLNWGISVGTMGDGVKFKREAGRENILGYSVSKLVGWCLRGGKIHYIIVYGVLLLFLHFPMRFGEKWIWLLVAARGSEWERKYENFYRYFGAAFCACFKLYVFILDYNLSFYESRVLWLLSILVEVSGRSRCRRKAGHLIYKWLRNERKCVRKRTQWKCENILFIISINSQEHRRNQGERSRSNIFARI